MRKFKMSKEGLVARQSMLGVIQAAMGLPGYGLLGTTSSMISIRKAICASSSTGSPRARIPLPAVKCAGGLLPWDVAHELGSPWP